MSRMMLLKRFVRALALIVAASFLVFAASEYSPRHVTSKTLGPYASQASKDFLFEKLELDAPLFVRYGRWLGVLTGVIKDPLANPELNLGFTDRRGHQYFGNFGHSSLYQAPVNDVLWGRLGATAILAGIAFAIIVPLSVVVGVLSGTREDALIDRGLSLTGITLGSIPEFASAILLMAIFVVWLGWLPGPSTLVPTAEWPVASQMVLPVIALVLYWLGQIATTVRGSIIDLATRPSIRTEGPEHPPYKGRVWRDATIVSARTILPKLPWLLTSIVVIEVIFAYPGFGRMLIETTFFGDIAMAEAAAVVAIFFW